SFGVVCFVWSSGCPLLLIALTTTGVVQRVDHIGDVLACVFSNVIGGEHLAMGICGSTGGSASAVVSDILVLGLECGSSQLRERDGLCLVFRGNSGSGFAG